MNKILIIFGFLIALSVAEANKISIEDSGDFISIESDQPPQSWIYIRKSDIVGIRTIHVNEQLSQNRIKSYARIEFIVETGDTHELFLIDLPPDEEALGNFRSMLKSILDK
tara:strand:- start:193 stop:525 length:333 start_codon:yes stop_codon:yes gene_type:complete